MAKTAPGQAPALPSRLPSSLDQAPQLVGHLNADGTANLEVDNSYVASKQTTKAPRALKEALKAAGRDYEGTSLDVVSDSASEEDYDALLHDPMTVKLGGKGGGYDVHSKGPAQDTDKEYDNSIAPTKSTPSLKKLKSVPVILKRSTENGRYILRADDETLRELLQLSVEREKNPASAKRRRKFSNLVFTRQFTAFDRNNTESAGSPFHGFFVLFWLAIAIMILRIASANWRESGNVLGTNEIMGIMFHRDLLVLSVSDGVLCATTGFGFLLQKLILEGWLSWNGAGWVIQSVWEVFYLVAFVGWTLFREWPWTHTVFFVLHGLVMLMKQHSYAFYNGHLSEAYKKREILRRKLKQLEHVDMVETPSSSTPAVTSLSTSYLEEKPIKSGVNQRRQNNTNSSMGKQNIAQVAEAIESGEPLDIDQIHIFERIIMWEIDALNEDLKGKASFCDRFYPNNLTTKNHYEYIVLPTLVYELEYPRSDSISWYYVAEKTVATFGILMIMNMVSQAYIYPVVVRTLEMKEIGLPLRQRLETFPLILGDLIFPFLLEFLMSWYIIWECILNVLAELTYFADRGFYADWWNSVSWDQYARDWNRPVHTFLLRHVYHSSISSMRVNKNTATLITFFLSAVVHELTPVAGNVVFVQEASWLSSASPDVPAPADPDEPEQMAQGQGNIGQSDILGRDFHWTKSPMQSVFDHLNMTVQGRWVLVLPCLPRRRILYRACSCTSVATAVSRPSGGQHVQKSFIRPSSSSTRWKTRQGRDSFAKEAKIQGLKSRAAFKLFKKGQTVVDLGYAPGSWSQVAVERTKPSGRIVGIDIIPAQPPKGVSTIQGNFLSVEVQAEVKRFLQEPDRGRPIQSQYSTPAADTDTSVAGNIVDSARSYIDLERHVDEDNKDGMIVTNGKSKSQEDSGRVVDVVLSDMSAPWEQTTGFWKKSLSNPYFRMMNTSGINFKDHAGSMDLCTAALQFAYDTLRAGGHFVCKFYQGAEDKHLEAQLKRLFASVHREKPESSRSESKEAYFVALRRKRDVDRSDLF
ncbi:hypothetical protein BP6252_13401 [Coleophoma cylindrospora]|uniref:Ribosomal RNA methyltransferase FtsJ domain-containing protein n=1 Tax=Coleophoma cylindrospora TaxID=1849047 RepID=A0A3D8Q8J2_9HELO|nr:hypothetical protein BP6252_13401 [Coleophoma cylindrospora]